MEVVKEKDMKLLSRKRVIINLEGKSTPSRLDLLKDIAKKFGTKEDHVVIKHIYPQFGKTKVRIIAHIYQDKEKIKVFEHPNLLKKHVKKVVEEKPAEA